MNTVGKIIQTSRFGWLCWIGLAIGLIWAFSFLSLRFDFTSEKRFTISKPTRQLLKGIKEPVKITVLLSEPELPSFFKKLAGTTQNFLRDCQSISGGNIQYRFISPQSFLEDTVNYPFNDTLKANWLKDNAIKLNEQTKASTNAFFVYPIALLQQNDRVATVNFLQGQSNQAFLNPENAAFQYEMINNAEAQMEYSFAAALQSLMQSVPPIVAYSTGHGEPVGANTYHLRQTLQSRYRFFSFNLAESPFISDSIRVLVLAKPSMPFSEEDKLKLDQYILRGGNVLFLLDALQADMDSLVATGREFTAFSRNLNLEDLLFKYGARVNHDLATDIQCDMLPQAVGGTPQQPQIELLPWPYFPLLYSVSNHPITKNLDAVIMQFPNSVDTVKAPGIRKDILLATSNTSRIAGAPVIISVEILKHLENASAFTDKNIPLAVLLQGKFQSLYANRLNADQLEFLQQQGRPFLPTASKPATILVTGDGDWVLNGFERDRPLAMGTNPYTKYEFANQNFLLNSIDFMTDETGIMASRSKSFQLRALDPKKLEQQKTTWQWLNIGLPLLVLLIIVLAFQYVRNMKFGKA